MFSKAFALRAGYFSLPSVRSLTGTYPFFPGTDRSMATNYMRPGFTQGVWANGELFPGFNYIAMIGNSLNTLDIAATNIDNNFAYAASRLVRPQQFGKAWNDYEYHDAPALRVGTAFTFAREDRLSDLATASPENNATFISDGTLALRDRGAGAGRHRLQLANFYLWAIDAGIKYRGLAFNAEFYQRWLNHFEADGPLPIDSHVRLGLRRLARLFRASQRLEPYVRTSLIKGPFGTAVEGAVGVNWYPFDTRRVWLSVEAIGIEDSPYGSGYYVYSVGPDRSAGSRAVPAALLRARGARAHFSGCNTSWGLCAFVRGASPLGVALERQGAAGRALDTHRIDEDAHGLVARRRSGRADREPDAVRPPQNSCSTGTGAPSGKVLTWRFVYLPYFVSMKGCTASWSLLKLTRIVQVTRVTGVPPAAKTNSSRWLMSLTSTFSSTQPVHGAWAGAAPVAGA